MCETEPYMWQVNIVYGNKPLPELMFTQIYVAIWRHYATMR